MVGGLPEGLVSNKKGVATGIEDALRLEAGDTMKLWRIYSSGNAAIAENVGRRLENFFWRIAMSERLRERLNGAQIDRQFDRISQGGRIRTTPTPSPRSSRGPGSPVKEARSTFSSQSTVSSSLSSSEAAPARTDEEREDISAVPTSQSPFQTISEVITQPKENRRTTTIRPPPILKKADSGSNRPSRSPSLLSGSWSTAGAGNEGAVAFDDDVTPTESVVPNAGRSARKLTTTRFNEEVAVSIPKASTVSRVSGGRLSSESGQRSGRRNPIVVANSGTSKRRPPLMRQRSSQASSFGALKEPSSKTSTSPNLPPSMKPADTDTAKHSSDEAEASLAQRSRGASPHPSKARKILSPSPTSSEGPAEDSGDDGAVAQESSTNPVPEPSLVEDVTKANPEVPKPLVDSDFRAQFVDKIRPSNRSFTNISSLARKSSAAVPTAASFQASGMLDTGQASYTAGSSRGREAFKNEIVPLKAPASAGPEPPAEASQPLPRTKSQLTLLLEREENRSAGQERGEERPRKP